MKRKMILPLLAIVFALASAFATAPVTQTAWFHVNPNSNDEGVIDNTTQPCVVGRQIQCTISGMNAYDSPANANTQSAPGLLKYNP